MTRPSLVIFDCDGVLVDTETIANTRLAEIVTEAGLPISMAESRRRFTGLSMKSMVQILRAEEGIDLGEDFVDRWNAGLPALFSDGLEAVPHVHQAIDALKSADIPYCVASSGKIAKMHLTLGATGLLPYFKEVLFSAWSVERGKPFPDLFLHAAASMGHKPEVCVVIEDSLPGVRAGVAANMTVLGYCGDPLTDAQSLAAAGAVTFDDMRRLPDLLTLR